MAGFQLRIGLVLFFEAWCKAKYSAFITATTYGNDRQVLAILRSDAVSDSIALSM